MDDLLRDVKAHAGQLDIILRICEERGFLPNASGIVQSYSNLTNLLKKPTRNEVIDENAV